MDSCRRSIALSMTLLLVLSWIITAQTQELVPKAATTKVVAFKREPSPAGLKWANDELRRMSIEEKIGQLLAVGVNATFLNQQSETYRTLKHHVEDNMVGSIILFRGPVYESVVLVNRMQQLARYPLLVSADLEAGAG